MIKPTIGRVVLVFDGISDQALPALICYVHSDSCINVAGFGALGFPFKYKKLNLVEEADEFTIPPYATWMPYQKLVAAKQIEETKHA